MKRLVVLLIIAVSFFSTGCTGKKRQALLFPMMAALVDGSKEEIKVQPGIPETSGGNTVTYTGQVPTGEDEPQLSEVVPGITVEEVSAEDSNFSFQGTRTIAVDALVVDQDGNPVPDALVRIMDSDLENTLLSQLASNPEGKVLGSIVVNYGDQSIVVYVTVSGQNTQAIIVPILRDDSGVMRLVVSIERIQIPVHIPPPVVVVDSDTDGVPDTQDAYPSDPSKATKLRFPSQGVNTIAYEDLYPVPGDADLNDTVIRFYNEEDLNAKGEIVEIRGYYHYVAHGAGYKHSVHLRFSNQLKASFHSVVTDSNGMAQPSQNISLSEVTEQNWMDGLQVFGHSDTTIGSNWNARSSDVYKPGFIAKTVLRFNNPVSRSTLGTAPYDLFIRIENKSVDSKYPSYAPTAFSTDKKKYEVHLPGIYKKPDGKDAYLDNNGFPWAILTPGEFKWPLEAKDIRASNSPYPKFNSWANSFGTKDADWYLFPNLSLVYTSATPSPLE